MRNLAQITTAHTNKLGQRGMEDPCWFHWPQKLVVSLIAGFAAMLCIFCTTFALGESVSWLLDAFRALLPTLAAFPSLTRCVVVVCFSNMEQCSGTIGHTNWHPGICSVSALKQSCTDTASVCYGNESIPLRSSWCFILRHELLVQVEV